ncbi:biotin--[acetyl-CoA-carboxylase] ligase [Pseudonocardiaceae bacterium YIM PH 21723]|nr:biotin--[acetyl-CoA-carboxylase] ligase [Pseudonocardiaceae bacterium YIM PH 21723]
MQKLDRSPLNLAELRARLTVPAGALSAVDVVDQTGSTNADLVAAAASGAADRTVLIAEQQVSGKGRQQRSWESPARAGLYLSVLLRPAQVPPSRYGWLSLLAGVALADTVSGVAGVSAGLKWPNDLLVDGRKCAGILAEAASGAVVIGIGLNVSHSAEELPEAPGGLPATSLQLCDAKTTDRTELAIALLERFTELEHGWRRHVGDPESSGLLAAYRARCATLGQSVRALLPDGKSIEGVASDIDKDGRLVILTGDGVPAPVSAGDIVHLRPAT